MPYNYPHFNYPVPMYSDWLTGTPVIPKFYWDVKSPEQRIKYMCCELAKITAYLDNLVDILNEKIDTINQKIEELNDTIARLELVIQDLRNTIAELELVIQDLRNTIADVRQAMTDLEDALAAETARATAAEQTNANAIAAETTRATAAEQTNTDAIAAEVTRATAAEQTNANAIAAETTRADATFVKRAGDTMTGQLKTIAPVDGADAANKAYVDAGYLHKANVDDDLKRVTAVNGLNPGTESYHILTNTTDSIREDSIPTYTNAIISDSQNANTICAEAVGLVSGQGSNKIAKPYISFAQDSINLMLQNGALQSWLSLYTTDESRIYLKSTTAIIDASTKVDKPIELRGAGQNGRIYGLKKEGITFPTSAVSKEYIEEKFMPKDLTIRFFDTDNSAADNDGATAAGYGNFNGFYIEELCILFIQYLSFAYKSPGNISTAVKLPAYIPKVSPYNISIPNSFLKCCIPKFYTGAYPPSPRTESEFLFLGIVGNDGVNANNLITFQGGTSTSQELTFPNYLLKGAGLTFYLKPFMVN